VLTEDAIADFHAWREIVRKLEKPATGLYKGWLGKMHGLCLRIALVMTNLDRCSSPEPQHEPKEVDRLHIQAARHFLESYAIPMALRIFGTMALPEDERDARALAKWLVAQEPIPEAINERRIMRERGAPDIDTRERLIAALELLADEGWVRPPKGKSGKRGGRPKLDWTINPAVALINTQSAGEV